MNARTIAVLLSLAMMTAAPGFAAASNGGSPADDGVEPTTMPAALEHGILIYDDGPEASQAARQAVENLQLPHEFTSDPCRVAQTAENDRGHLIVVNSIFGIFSGCSGQADVFADLAAYAEPNEQFAIVQSWELDLCGDDSSVSYEVPCSRASVDQLLGVLGVQGPLATSFEPVTLQATPTVNACGVAPDPWVPGVDAIEPTNAAAIRNAQGVNVVEDEALACFTDAAGNAQVAASGDGVYVGAHPVNYVDGRSTTLPGPTDMVKLYENLLAQYG